MKTIEKFFGSKTFRFLFLVFLVGSIALFVGKLSSELWVELMKWLGGYGMIRGTAENVDVIKRRKKDEIANTLNNRTDAELANDIVSRTES